MTMDEQLIRAMSEKLTEAHTAHGTAQDRLHEAQTHTIHMVEAVERLRSLTKALQDALLAMGLSYDAVYKLREVKVGQANDT